MLVNRLVGSQCPVDFSEIKHSKCKHCVYGYSEDIVKTHVICGYSTVTGSVLNDDNYHTAKHDKGKTRFDLVPLEEIKKIADVLEHGASIHGENTWQKVPEAKKRFFAALMRHLADYQKGVKVDKDSGLNPLWHVLTNAMFLCYFEENEESNG